MRGNKGQRAPSNWTPGFTVLPGNPIGKPPLREPPSSLPCEDWGVSERPGMAEKDLRAQETKDKKDKKAKHTKTRNRLLGFNNHSRLPTGHSFPLCDRIPQGGVHRAGGTALCQAAQAQDAPSREEASERKGPWRVKREKSADRPTAPSSSPHIPWPWGPSHIPIPGNT